MGTPVVFPDMASESRYHFYQWFPSHLSSHFWGHHPWDIFDIFMEPNWLQALSPAGAPMCVSHLEQCNMSYCHHLIALSHTSTLLSGLIAYLQRQGTKGPWKAHSFQVHPAAFPAPGRSARGLPGVPWKEECLSPTIS